MSTHCLRLLKGLRVETTYKVRGKTSKSTEWCPSRGLIEGCCSSPISFSIFHAEVMRQAGIERNELIQNRGLAMGIEWCYRKKEFFPPRDTTEGSGGSDTSRFRVHVRDLVYFRETVSSDHQMSNAITPV